MPRADTRATLIDDLKRTEALHRLRRVWQQPIEEQDPRRTIEDLEAELAQLWDEETIYTMFVRVLARKPSAEQLEHLGHVFEKTTAIDLWFTSFYELVDKDQLTIRAVGVLFLRCVVFAASKPFRRLFDFIIR